MHIKQFIIFLFISGASCCGSNSIFAQKHFFQHYNIESGLIQSQVTSITQDRDNQLWISTFGGIDCFDSREFTHFTVEDGLPANANFTITTDQNGEIWSGNSSGITSFDQSGIKNYPVEGAVKVRGVRQLMQDRGGSRWALTGYKLYKLVGGILTRQFVTTDTEQVTAIQVNQQGEFFAAVQGKGITDGNRMNGASSSPSRHREIPKAVSSITSFLTVFFRVKYISYRPGSCILTVVVR
jgi:ligand-binding sensor domain-containing protein